MKMGRAFLSMLCIPSLWMGCSPSAPPPDPTSELVVETRIVTEESTPTATKPGSGSTAALKTTAGETPSSAPAGLTPSSGQTNSATTYGQAASEPPTEQTLTLTFIDASSGKMFPSIADVEPCGIDVTAFRFPGIPYQGSMRVSANLSACDGGSYQTEDQIDESVPAEPVTLAYGRTSSLSLTLFRQQSVNGNVTARKHLTFTISLTQEQQSLIDSMDAASATGTLSGCTSSGQDESFPLASDSDTQTLAWQDKDASFFVNVGQPCHFEVQILDSGVVRMQGDTDFVAEPDNGQDQYIGSIALEILDAQIDITLKLSGSNAEFTLDIASIAPYLDGSNWSSPLTYQLTAQLSSGDTGEPQSSGDPVETQLTRTGDTLTGSMKLQKGLYVLSLAIQDGTYIVLGGSTTLDVSNQTKVSMVLYYFYDAAAQTTNLTNVYFRAYLDGAPDQKSGIVVQVTGLGVNAKCHTGTGNDPDDSIHDGDYTCLIRLPPGTDSPMRYQAEYSYPGYDTATQTFGVSSLDSMALPYVALTPGATEGMRTYYLDLDGDGYGDLNFAIQSASPVSGYVVSGTDCDDDDPEVHPGASDTSVDGLDGNCDGVVDWAVRVAGLIPGGVEGGLATDSVLDSAFGVARDRDGNLYIADIHGSRILKVSAATGILTTIAGNGTQGYSGDGGAATSAQLYDPSGVAVDGQGNVYIADLFNNRIRKVTAATGIISTVAGNGSDGYSGDGGPATSAQLIEPQGVTVDGQGNLFIAVIGYPVIRKVTAATGIISTVAGNGTLGYGGDGGSATSAQLGSPMGVALDGQGNLYIADSYEVRKVTAATGIITTIAGNGTQGYSGDGAAATSAQFSGVIHVAVDGQGNVYIADSGNQVIRKVFAATGIITTIAGTGRGDYYGDGGAATSAELCRPNGVAVDTDGNLYIADDGNYRIRKVTAATGIITTVAGNNKNGYGGDGGAATSAQFFNPTGVTLDGQGNLYIADTSNRRIRKVTADTGTVTTVAGNGYYGYSGDGGAATSAWLAYPANVTVDGQGNLYIADAYSSAIRKVTAATGIITTVAGNGSNGYSGDGGLATSAQLVEPEDVKVDGQGNLYIADFGNHRIRKVTAATGIITTVAGNGSDGYSGDGGPATSASINHPRGVALDTAGNLYIADYYNNRIRKVTAATGIITTVAGPGEFDYPESVTLDAAGNLYIADSQGNRIMRMAADTGLITTVAGTGEAGANMDAGPATDFDLNYPTAVIIDPLGKLYIADTGNNRILKITP